MVRDRFMASDTVWVWVRAGVRLRVMDWFRVSLGLTICIELGKG